MLDALKHIALEVPCPACSDSYSVSAETIRESQMLLAQGCPGTSTHECAPLYYATLLPARALDGLAVALRELERAAWARGARGVWVAAPEERDVSSSDVCWDVDPVALSRWEDDGGPVQPLTTPSREVYKR